MSSKQPLASIKGLPEQMDHFREKVQTTADIEVFILDEVFASLPTPPFSVEEKERVAKSLDAHIWQQAVRGDFTAVA